MPFPAERPPPRFGVYVHWPFCAAKCPYCDFNSHVRRGDFDESRFLRAYLRELASLAERVPNRRVETVFFGGGTPSLMHPRTVAAILDAIAGHWSLVDSPEVTLEANPASADTDGFAGYRKAGVNRLSLGVQALEDGALKRLGRLHGVAEARRAIELARRIFPRLSLDLIYARPGQSLADWQRELRHALQLAGDHLSLYQLTIEEGTPFATLQGAGRLSLPDADLAAEFYRLSQRLTHDAGLPAYEISNHARPGAECRHNLLYWQHGEYLGIGAGAHSRLHYGGARHALATETRPEDWCAAVEARGHGLVLEQRLTGEQIGDEFLLMGMRLATGIDLARHARLSGRTLDPKRLSGLVERGMVEITATGRLRATAAGALVLNAVIEYLAAS